jgi:hypothetical protein
MFDAACLSFTVGLGPGSETGRSGIGEISPGESMELLSASGEVGADGENSGEGLRSESIAASGVEIMMPGRRGGEVTFRESVSEVDEVLTSS